MILTIGVNLALEHGNIDRACHDLIKLTNAAI